MRSEYNRQRSTLRTLQNQHHRRTNGLSLSKELEKSEKSVFKNAFINAIINNIIITVDEKYYPKILFAVRYDSLYLNLVVAGITNSELLDF